MGNKILKTLRVALLNPVTTGIAKTLAKVKRHYYWKGMTDEILLSTYKNVQNAKNQK